MTVTSNYDPAADWPVQVALTGGVTRRVRYAYAARTVDYVYDALRRLSAETVAVTGNPSANFNVHYDVVNGGSLTEGYDHVGNRRSRRVVDDRNPTGYAQVVEERQWGSPTVVYVYGLSLINQTRGTTTSYYGTDGQGSVRYLTSGAVSGGTPAGIVTDTYTYDAFGIQITSSGTTPNNYRYTGQQWDADLGLYYLRARYFDPKTGRFWTMDTEEGQSEDPLSLHKYLYAGDDPVDYDDPTGNDYEIAGVLGALDIGGILAQISNPVSSKAVTAIKAALRARPKTQDARLLAAAIYAESSSKDYSGTEDAVEKWAIGATIVNQAFYAKLPPRSKQKRNYNAASFGDGTVLGAIKKSIVAYKGKAWNKVANPTDLLPDASIDKTLLSTARDHYNLSVDAANAMTAVPMGIKDFNNEGPIGFNQAKDSPPNAVRQHRIGAAGVHTFYGFDKGHEYQ